MSEVEIRPKLNQQLEVFGNEHHIELEIGGIHKLVTGPCFRHNGFAWPYMEGRDKIPESARRAKALFEANFPVRQWVYVDEAPFGNAPQPKPKAPEVKQPKAPEVKLNIDSKPILETLLGLAVVAGTVFVSAAVITAGLAITAITMIDPMLVAYVEIPGCDDLYLAVVVAKWAH